MVCLIRHLKLLGKKGIQNLFETNRERKESDVNCPFDFEELFDFMIENEIVSAAILSGFKMTM